jgi:hypothetical protein
VFIASRTIVDGDATSTPRDFRLAIVHILLAGYSAFAYAYLIYLSRKTSADLASVPGLGYLHWILIAAQILLAPLLIRSWSARRRRRSP